MYNVVGNSVCTPMFKNASLYLMNGIPVLGMLYYSNFTTGLKGATGKPEAPTATTGLKGIGFPRQYQPVQN